MSVAGRPLAGTHQAPGRLEPDEQGKGEAENGQCDNELEQRETRLPAATRGGWRAVLER